MNKLLTVPEFSVENLLYVKLNKRSSQLSLRRYYPLGAQHNGKSVANKIIVAYGIRTHIRRTTYSLVLFDSLLLDLIRT